MQSRFDVRFKSLLWTLVVAVADGVRVVLDWRASKHDCSIDQRYLDCPPVRDFEASRCSQCRDVENDCHECVAVSYSNSKCHYTPPTIFVSKVTSLLLSSLLLLVLTSPTVIMKHAMILHQVHDKCIMMMMV